MGDAPHFDPWRKAEFIKSLNLRCLFLLKLFQKIKCDTAAVDSSIKSIFSERGDLDFAEQLWCKMRSKCVVGVLPLLFPVWLSWRNVLACC